MKPLVVTPGDPEGIGPEIVWKAVRSGDVNFKDLLCVGAIEPFRRLGARIQFPGEASTRRPSIRLLPAPAGTAGFQSGWSIQEAVRLVLAGNARGLVTGPISKTRLRAGGFPFPGHTEMLASLTRTPRVTMMLANDQLRVSLVTTHLPLCDVSSALNPKIILEAIVQTHTALKKWWKISKPRIAVLGLNPHAGEGGLLGKEESRKIDPAIRKARSLGLRVEGPFPADTFFALHRTRKLSADAVVCMYHDQGLIPVKMLDFPNTVNVTLGLPIIRTSVDHGVGFDIAGQGVADPSSFVAAVRLAQRLTRPRKT